MYEEVEIEEARHLELDLVEEARCNAILCSTCYL
jgi:hypothetical protein